MRLIDADELLTERKMSKYYHLPNGDIAIPIIDIEHAPTVHPKTGRWIYHPDWESDGECAYECDQCGMGSDVDYNYCMRCGAKMKDKNGTVD